MIKRMKAIGKKMRGNWVRKLHGCRPIHLRTSMTTPLTTHSKAITPARPANHVKALDSGRGVGEFKASESWPEESRGGRCEEGELLMTTTVPPREVVIGHAKKGRALYNGYFRLSYKRVLPRCLSWPFRYRVGTEVVDSVPGQRDWVEDHSESFRRGTPSSSGACASPSG